MKGLRMPAAKGRGEDSESGSEDILLEGKSGLMHKDEQHKLWS